MGADELSNHYAPGIKIKAPQHFKTAENTRIEVDTSYFPHALIKRPKNAMCAFCVLAHTPK